MVRKRRSAAAPARRRGIETGTFASSPLRAAIVWLVALKVFAVLILFVPAGLQPFDLPKSLLSRAFEWSLIGVIGASLLRHGFAIVPRTRLHALVALYALTVVVSAAFAQDHYIALYGDWLRYLGLTFTGDMLVLYAAVAIGFRTRTDWLMLGAAVAAGCVVAVVYAWIQFAGGDPVRWLTDPRRRPFGTLGNADHFAHLLGAVAAAALALAVVARETAIRRAAAALAAILLATALVVATRAVFVGIGAGALTVAAIFVALRGLERATIVRLGVATAGAAALVAITLVATPLGARSLATLSGVEVRDRLLIWDSALRVVRDHPLVGVGPDGFGVVYLAYRQPGTEGIFSFERDNSAHDWALQTAATTGIPSALALLALVIAGSVLLARQVSGSLRETRLTPEVAAPLLAGSIAYWAQGLLTVGAIAIDWVPYVALGGAAALAGRRSGAERARGGELAPIGAIALAVVAALTPAWAFAANLQAKAAQSLVDADRGAAARAPADAAISLDAGRPEYWVVHGRMSSAIGREREAGDDYAQAAARAPWNADLWMHLGASRAKQAIAGDQSSGGAEAALAASRRVVAADPNDSSSHYHLATVAFNLKDYATALRAAVDAIALFQEKPEYDDVAAQAADRLADRAAAREMLEEALRYKRSDVLRAALARASGG